MGLVTGIALSHSDRRVDLGPWFFHRFRELRVAVETKFRRVLLELRFERAPMWVVTADTVLLRGRMGALDVLAAAENGSMTRQTKFRAFYVEEFRRATGVGYVTDRAAAALEGRVKFSSLESATHAVVAVEAQLILRLDKILGVIARMRAVAARASAIGHRTMHIDLVELFLLGPVARVTKSLDRGIEERGVFRSVGIMAGRALFRAEGVVDRFAL